MTEIEERRESMVNLQHDMKHIIDKMDHEFAEVIKRLDYTNGKVRTLTTWKAKIEGGKDAIKSIWGIFGIVVMAGFFGMFNMYMDFKSLQQTISNIELNNKHIIEQTVEKEVSKYFDIK